ncbi:hypothetical protein [Hugenholtzia roseola]|uniref:hypothetical protein n=1 Tax=Hugenholtzia roseola TaxID=1002 RepID=UPI0004146010|nr:hypothetical protein [Hugenholtzia roseola]
MSKLAHLTETQATLKALATQEQRLAYFMELQHLPNRFTYLQASVLPDGTYGQQVRLYIEVEEVYFTLLFTIRQKKGVNKVLQKICKQGWKYINKAADEILVDFIEAKDPKEVLTAYKGSLEEVCKQNNNWK